MSENGFEPGFMVHVPLGEDAELLVQAEDDFDEGRALDWGLNSKAVRRMLQRLVDNGDCIERSWRRKRKTREPCFIFAVNLEYAPNLQVFANTVEEWEHVVAWVRSEECDALEVFGDLADGYGFDRFTRTNPVTAEVPWHSW